ncbi:MAG: hypothetical protein K1X48_01015 [Burkholderiaceae bacterium]|nr:hypothetical protein [Burkholderiaceae bacterium]
MFKSLLWGGVTVVLGNVIWLGLINYEPTYLGAITFQYLTPAVAGFVAAWFANQHKLLLGVAFGVLSSIAIGAANLLFELLGHKVDFSGFDGAVIVTVWSTPFCLIAATLGAAIAVFLLHQKSLK